MPICSTRRLCVVDQGQSGQIPPSASRPSVSTPQMAPDVREYSRHVLSKLAGFLREMYPNCALWEPLQLPEEDRNAGHRAALSLLSSSNTVGLTGYSSWVVTGWLTLAQGHSGGWVSYPRDTTGNAMMLSALRARTLAARASSSTTSSLDPRASRSSESPRTRVIGPNCPVALV